MAIQAHQLEENTIYCSVDGTRHSRDAKFCMQCGRPLGAGGTGQAQRGAQSPQQGSTELGRFRTRRGGTAVVSPVSVIWFDADNSTSQLVIRDMSSVMGYKNSNFFSAATYVCRIYKLDAYYEETEFATKQEMEGMVAAVQAAMTRLGT